MAVSSLVPVLIVTIVTMDLLLIALLAMLGTLFTGFVGLKALTDFVEKLINQLILDILKHLDSFIKSKSQGKAVGFMVFLVDVARTVYKLLYAAYSMIGVLISCFVTAGAGILAILAFVLLIVINLLLVYLIGSYILGSSLGFG